VQGLTQGWLIGRALKSTHQKPARLIVGEGLNHDLSFPASGENPPLNSSTLKRDRMSWAFYRRQQRQQSPEAFSASSATSCATDAAVPHHVPGGAASDYPRHPRDPRSLPRHGVIPLQTKSTRHWSQRRPKYRVWMWLR
jgi:hypothetical protein